MSFLTIDNSKEKAISSGKWKNPGAKFYQQLLEAISPTQSDCKDELTYNWQDYLKEAYLIAPVNKIKNSPYGVTPYTNSGCKYPHHVIRKGELVVSIPGLKAAYQRACQQKILKGDVKEHLERHIKEMGITASFHNGKLSWNENGVIEEKIEENFHKIYQHIYESMRIDLFTENDYFKVLKSDLSDDFKSKGQKTLSDFKMMKITKDLTKKFKDQGKLISYMRDDDPKYDDECLLWVDDKGNYVCSITYDKVPNKEDSHTWISGMDVAYAYNGYGLSHQLLDYAIAHGVDALSVQKDNEIALKTYKSHGFEISKESQIKVDNGLSNQYDMFIHTNSNLLTESAMSNEAIVLNSNTLNEIGHTPEEIYEWMHQNISYDHCGLGEWKLKTPSEVYEQKKGNCHDQSLFESFLFHALNIINGQLFFIEYKEGDSTGGNTHTLTWYRTAQKEAKLSADWKSEFKEKNAAKGSFKYYWFENAWEDQAGIHGPYDSIDLLKEDVRNIWKHDHDLNSGNYNDIAFGKYPSYQVGMSLGEYVESWKLEEAISNETYYRVTHNGIGIYEAMRKQTSAKHWKELLSSDIFTWLPKPKEYPEGHLSYFTKAGIQKFNELVLPEAESIVGDNIKIDKFSKDEIGNIVYQDKYQVITDGNNAIQEAFDWMDQYLYQEMYESVNELENISTTDQLLSFMDQIQYGIHSKEKDIIGDDWEGEDFYNQYRLQSPSELIQSKVGVCWDQTELEREWFKSHSILHWVIYIELNDGAGCPSHTFVLFQSQNGKIHWFEHSWGKYRGIHPYESTNEAIKDIVEKHRKTNHDFKSPLLIHDLHDVPTYGCTCEEFMDYAHQQPEIQLDKEGDDIIEESYDLKSLPNIMYFSSPTKLASKTIGSKSPRGLFLSPYIGISSIFLIDRHKVMNDYFEEILAKNNREIYRTSYNITYREWNLPDAQLTHPLRKVHMYHNVPNFKEIRTGTATGFIYAIDVSSVKDELEVFVTNDANREVIYKGSARLPIKEVTEHTLDYEISYQNNGKTGVVETRPKKETNLNENKTIDTIECEKCHTVIPNPEILEIPKSRYEEVAAMFPNWDGRYGKLKRFHCPECKHENYFITDNDYEESYDILDESINDTSLEDIEKFFQKLRDYEYIIPNNGKIIRKIKLDSFKHYKTLTPEEFEKYHGGICWDYVAYQADYFNKHFPSVPYKIYMIAFMNGKDNPSHSIMIFHYKDKFYWREASWKKYKGKGGDYNSEKEAIESITKILKSAKDHLKDIKEIIKEYDPSKYYGLSEHDFFVKLIPNYDQMNAKALKESSEIHPGIGLDGINLNWMVNFLIEEGFDPTEFLERSRGVNMEDDLDWMTDILMEDVEDPPSMEENPSEEQKPEQKEEPKKESYPKKVDRKESDKNGVRRKKLYIAFIEWCKAYNSKNTFGSVFDQDAFDVSYPFVPYEMRYFYRLANPMLCVLGGNLTFFQLAELRKLNTNNSDLTHQMIFAATEHDLRVFNKRDKKVYFGVEEDGRIKLTKPLAPTFDQYIQTMIDKGDILNGPIDEE